MTAAVLSTAKVFITGRSQAVPLQKVAGAPIAETGLLIAYHALGEEMTLVTNDTREFERIEGLKLENWV